MQVPRGLWSDGLIANGGAQPQHHPVGRGGQAAHDAAAGAVIYSGALVCVDAAGLAVPGADAASLKFIGLAYRGFDNTMGSAGDALTKMPSGADRTVRTRHRTAERSDSSFSEPPCRSDFEDCADWNY